MAIPWTECPTFTVDYDRPVSEYFSAAPPELVEKGRNLLSAVMTEIPGRARPLADAVRIRTANRFHKEIVNAAELINANWRDLMLANVSYDLSLSMFGCSTVVLAGPDGPVVARNMDWWPEDILAKSSCLVRYESNGQLAFANAGWPGSVGVVTGLSGRGFAVVLNAVLSDEGGNTTGYPVMLHLRRVIEDAKDFDDALRMLTKTKLAMSGLITLVGSENNQRVVVERTPTRHSLRWPNNANEPLVTTNDYRLLEKPTTNDSAEIYQTTCNRFDYLTRFFSNTDPTKHCDDTRLLFALTDESVIQTITAQHIIMRPRQRKVGMFVPSRFD